MAVTRDAPGTTHQTQAQFPSDCEHGVCNVSTGLFSNCSFQQEVVELALFSRVTSILRKNRSFSGDALREPQLC